MLSLFEHTSDFITDFSSTLEKCYALNVSKFIHILFHKCEEFTCQKSVKPD